MRRAAVALALACAACSSPADAPGFLAVRQDFVVSVPAKGELEATQASPVAVPRVPTGALKVKELAPEGAVVRKGDVVVVFDDTQLSVELENQQATLRSADRKIDRNGYEGTIEKGAMGVMRSVAELERDHVDEFAARDAEVFSKIEMLRDSVRRTDAEQTIVYADAGLRLRGAYYDIEERILGVERGQAGDKIGRAETSLAQLVLKAPLDGMIVYKKNWRGAATAVGDTLWPGNVIMSIVDPSKVAVQAHVLEKDAVSLKPGAVAEVVVDAFPERRFAGKVRSVADLASPIERGSPVKYFETWVDLDEGDPALLRPGMKATARIRAGEAKDAIVVPRAVVSGSPEAPEIRVAAGRSTVTRSVKLGLGDAVRVVVTEGVNEGDRLLLATDEGPKEGSAPDPPGPGA